ncbi:MAG: hypothetical protein HYT39_01280 [Candidatus Sungbacteria bacterium]|nr:hypothetical protein [Candidatus Sungbacteria bacterium]
MTRLRIFRNLAAVLVLLAGAYAISVVFYDLLVNQRPGMRGWAEHNRPVTMMKLVLAASAAAIGGLAFFLKEIEMQRAKLAGLSGSYYVGFGRVAGFILIAFVAAGCALVPYDSRPGAVLYVSQRLVEVLRGNSICLINVPNEMLTTAQDYFRAAGAEVVYDCYRAHFRLFAQYNTESVSYGGLFGTVNGVSLVYDRRLVMRLTLTTRNSAGVEQLMFNGSAAALYAGSYGYGHESAIRSAGDAALRNLH